MSIVMIDIQLTEESLRTEACLAAVETPEAGAVNLFVGTVRSKTQGKQVLHLEYEAYEPMAVSEMRKIAEEAMRLFPVKKVAIHHRVGRLEIGDKAVVIAVATPHRREGFEACRHIIDTLKQTVPIWKKEVFEDGAVWVAAHP